MKYVRFMAVLAAALMMSACADRSSDTAVKAPAVKKGDPKPEANLEEPKNIEGQPAEQIKPEDKQADNQSQPESKPAEPPVLVPPVSPVEPLPPRVEPAPAPKAEQTPAPEAPKSTPAPDAPQKQDAPKSQDHVEIPLPVPDLVPKPDAPKAPTEQQQAEQQRAEAERKAAEQKAAEQKAAEQKAAEQKAAEQKAAEQKAAEQKAAEQKAAEQKAAEQKAAEQKAAEQKAAEQKAAEQKAAEQKAAEQKAAEQKAAEQKAAEQKAAEQKAAIEQQAQTQGDAVKLEPRQPLGLVPANGNLEQKTALPIAKRVETNPELMQRLAMDIFSQPVPAKDQVKSVVQPQSMTEMYYIDLLTAPNREELDAAADALTADIFDGSNDLQTKTELLSKIDERLVTAKLYTSNVTNRQLYANSKLALHVSDTRSSEAVYQRVRNYSMAMLGAVAMGFKPWQSAKGLWQSTSRRYLRGSDYDRLYIWRSFESLGVRNERWTNLNVTRISSQQAGSAFEQTRIPNVWARWVTAGNLEPGEEQLILQYTPNGLRPNAWFQTGILSKEETMSLKELLTLKPTEKVPVLAENQFSWRWFGVSAAAGVMGAEWLSRKELQAYEPGGSMNAYLSTLVPPNQLENTSAAPQGDKK